MRILQVVNDMHRAGLETMLMNYYRNIDRTKIQFDFLTHRPYKSDYDDEILSLGGRMYYAPRLYPQNYIQYFRWMDKFFEEHLEYQIMHSHIDSMSYLPLLAAKRANVPVRIAHSHNTSIDRDLKYPLKQLFRTRITKVANEYCACGEEAGKFLFGNRDFKVIPNAIETERFIYKKEVRKRVRKELHFTDEFVVGHVGRLSYQKNHEFLLEIFAQLYTIYLGARLLLVGIGEKEQELRNKVQKLGLEDVVIFLLFEVKFQVVSHHFPDDSDELAGTVPKSIIVSPAFSHLGVIVSLEGGIAFNNIVSCINKCISEDFRSTF